LIGRQAKARKRERESGGEETRGPCPKAKRRSLKFASHPMKKAVVAPKYRVVSLRGRRKKRNATGMIATFRSLPEEKFRPIERQ
jgi:hypothetical protein